VFLERLILWAWEDFDPRNYETSFILWVIVQILIWLLVLSFIFQRFRTKCSDCEKKFFKRKIRVNSEVIWESEVFWKRESIASGYSEGTFKNTSGEIVGTSRENHYEYVEVPQQKVVVEDTYRCPDCGSEWRSQRKAIRKLNSN
jgi:DNA-directed RNA polymerase subunit RPC12/RpoP